MRHLVNQLYSYPFEMHTAIVIQQKSDLSKNKISDEKIYSLYGRISCIWEINVCKKVARKVEI